MTAALPLACDAAGEQADMSEDDPGSCALDGGLEVLCKTSASVEPGEGSLYHPSAWQQDKAFGAVGAFDDFERPCAEPGQLLGELWACIIAISEEMAQPGIQRVDCLDDADGAVTVLDIGRVNIDANKMTERIGDDVALASLDLLAGIKTARSAGFSSLDALAVDHASTRRWLPSCLHTCHHYQRVVDPLQRAVA